MDLHGFTLLETHRQPLATASFIRRARATHSAQGFLLLTSMANSHRAAVASFERKQSARDRTI